eukprot:UN22895
MSSLKEKIKGYLFSSNLFENVHEMGDNLLFALNKLHADHKHFQGNLNVIRDNITSALIIKYHQRQGDVDRIFVDTYLVFGQKHMNEINLSICAKRDEIHPLQFSDEDKDKFLVLKLLEEIEELEK